MARTGTRGWKGCAMCKYHKDRAYGDSERIHPNVLRRMDGKRKRITRKQIPEEWRQWP